MDIATQIEHFATKLREPEIWILQICKCYPNWTFYYKTERTFYFFTRKGILLLKLHILVQKWENFRFQFYKGENNIQIENFTKKMRELMIPIPQRWKCYSYWTLYYKNERTWDFIATKVILKPKLNKLLQNWELKIWHRAMPRIVWGGNITLW